MAEPRTPTIHTSLESSPLARISPQSCTTSAKTSSDRWPQVNCCTWTCCAPALGELQRRRRVCGCLYLQRIDAHSRRVGGSERRTPGAAHGLGGGRDGAPAAVHESTCGWGP